jgi:hypothetical protein
MRHASSLTATSHRRAIRILGRNWRSPASNNDPRSPGCALQMQMRNNARRSSAVASPQRSQHSKLRMLAARTVSPASSRTMDNARPDQAPALSNLEANYPALLQPDQHAIPLVRCDRRPGMGRLASQSGCLHPVRRARTRTEARRQNTGRRVGIHDRPLSTGRQLRAGQDPLGRSGNASPESAPGEARNHLSQPGPR